MDAWGMEDWMKRCDLVIFDCDGVVIDSEVISARMLIAELALYGVNVDRAYVARHFLGRSYPIVLTQIRADFGIELPDGFEADYRARLLRAFDTELKIMPGFREVLDRLAVPYCLATSSSPARLARSLGIVGLDIAFEGRTTTASEVSYGKPAPDLFLLSAERMGARPENCLVVEDSYPGVRAGLNAGMEVWRFTGGSHLAGLDLPSDPAARPHLEFASFSDFFHLAPELGLDSTDGRQKQ
jgi:HAD superfamily hydrolase (TIGR01509 family)